MLPSRAVNIYIISYAELYYNVSVQDHIISNEIFGYDIFNIIHITNIIHTFSVTLLPLGCAPAEISDEQVCSFGPGISVSCLGIWHRSWYLQKYISRITKRKMTKFGYSRTCVYQIIWKGFNTNLIFFQWKGVSKHWNFFLLGVLKISGIFHLYQIWESF